MLSSHTLLLMSFPRTTHLNYQSMVCAAYMYFQLRCLPSAIHSTAWSSRRCRVSTVFASTIHWTYSRLWLGGNASKTARAFALLCSALVRSGGTSTGSGALRGARGMVTPDSLSLAASLTSFTQLRAGREILDGCQLSKLTRTGFHLLAHRLAIEHQQRRLPESERAVLLEGGNADHDSVVIERRRAPFDRLDDVGTSVVNDVAEILRESVSRNPATSRCMRQRVDLFFPYSGSCCRSRRTESAFSSERRMC